MSFHIEDFSRSLDSGHEGDNSELSGTIPLSIYPLYFTIHMEIDWFVTYTPKAKFWGAQTGNYVHFLDFNFYLKNLCNFFDYIIKISQIMAQVQFRFNYPLNSFELNWTWTEGSVWSSGKPLNWTEGSVHGLANIAKNQTELNLTITTPFPTYGFSWHN